MDLNIANGSFSTINLSFSSSSMACNCKSETCSDLYDSDHFPIITKASINRSGNPQTRLSRWIFKLADWNKYHYKIESKIPELIQPPHTENASIDDILEKLITTMKDAANHAIPKSKAKTTERKT